MPVVGYRLYGALWQELFGRSLQDPPRRQRRGSGTQPCTECGECVKIDSDYVWTAVTIKLECMPGKGVIGLL